MIFICKENNGYFNKGEHYEVVPSPNQWNDNWLKVLDGNGKEIIDIQKNYLISISCLLMNIETNK